MVNYYTYEEAEALVHQFLASDDKLEMLHQSTDTELEMIDLGIDAIRFEAKATMADEDFTACSNELLKFQDMVNMEKEVRDNIP